MILDRHIRLLKPDPPVHGTDIIFRGVPVSQSAHTGILYQFLLHSLLPVVIHILEMLLKHLPYEGLLVKRLHPLLRLRNAGKKTDRYHHTDEHNDHSGARCRPSGRHGEEQRRDNGERHDDKREYLTTVDRLPHTFQFLNSSRDPLGRNLTGIPVINSPLWHSSVALLHHSSEALLRHASETLGRHSAKPLGRHSAKTLGRHSAESPGWHSAIALLRHPSVSLLRIDRYRRIIQHRRIFISIIQVGVFFRSLRIKGSHCSSLSYGITPGTIALRFFRMNIRIHEISPAVKI